MAEAGATAIERTGVLATRRDDRGPSPALVGLAAVAMAAALWTALIYAPSERVQGDVQRIMYVHVPAALTMYLAITIVFFSSIIYLQKRDNRWDEVAAAAGEVGLAFGTVVLTTGPMWARPVWGWWWTWDARLTIFFILWLILVGYVMLRSYGGAPEQVARYCAVLGIIAFINLPIMHYAVYWWRTMHPEPLIMTPNRLGGGLPGSMLAAIGVGLLAYVLLFCAIFVLRLHIERQTRRVSALRRILDQAHGEVG